MPRGRPRKIVDQPVVEEPGTYETRLIEATVVADLHLGDGRVIHSGERAHVSQDVADDLIGQGKAKLA